LDYTNSGLYSVTLANVYGSVTSAPASLVVHDACVSYHMHGGMYFGLRITGQPGRSYALRCTTNPNSPFSNWTLLGTNTLTGPDWFYMDMESPGVPYRLYGVKLVP
jgi:hypothetical protein